MGTEAKQRCSLFHQRRNNNFAGFTIRHRLTCLGIDNFNIHIIIPVMDPLLLLTGNTDTGTINLGQTIDIIELNSKLISDIFTHLLTPAF